MESEDKTAKETVFRAEALIHRNAGERAGDVIRLSPTWTAWAFYLIICLFIAGLAAVSFIRIDRFAPGATAVEHGRTVVLVPAVLASDIARGSLVEIGSESAEVVSFEETVLYPPDVKERFGVDIAVPSVVVATSASTDRVAAGTARVLVESRPILVALVPGLSALFGGTDA